MEVLMSRQSRRLSRLLVVVLLLSFSAAALSFIYKMNRQPNEPTAPVPPTLTASVSPLPAPATQPAGQASIAGLPPMIDQSPAMPAAAQTPPVSPAAPATQPAAFSAPPDVTVATQSVSSLL